jgi:SPP1 gp7 family putative phage head morphogenesis protein
MVLQLDPGDDEEQKIRMEVERQFSDELNSALRGQMNDLIPPTASDADVRAAPVRVGQTSGPVRDVLRRHLLSGADLGVSVSFDTLQNVGLGFDWTLAHTHAAQWASRYSYDLVSQINDTTKAQLQTAVDEWFTNPDSLGKLRQQLEPTFGARRAQLIAQTETTRAAYEGNMLGFEESGVVEESEWVTVNDERVCPTCGPLDGQRAPLRGTFPGGIDVPAHPGCRCFVRPVIVSAKFRPTWSEFGRNSEEPK